MSNTKKMSKPLIIAVAAVAAVVVIIVAAVAGGTETVDLADYTKIIVDGYNGYATAKVEYDFYGVEEFILYGEEGDKDIDEMSDEDFEDRWERLELLEEALDSIEYEINKEEEISNGDKLEVTFTWSEESEKLLKDEFKVKLEAGKVELKVEGLEEATVFDPFEYVDIECEGVSGFATAKIKIDENLNEKKDDFIIKSDGMSTIYLHFTETEKASIMFTLSKYHEVSDNEKITVNASANGLKEGMILSSNKKEYKAKTLEAFDTVSQLKTNIERIYDAYEAGNYYREYITPVNCFYAVSENNEAQYSNKVFAVYKYESTGWFAEKYYYAVELSNCYEDAEGNIKYVAKENISGKYNTAGEAIAAAEKEIDTNYYTYTKG